ncbi:MAG: outer membrane lipoprotein-sorting protein [Terriglobia bacterium]
MVRPAGAPPGRWRCLGPANDARPSQGTPPIPAEEIIRKFAAKEEEFRRARDKYTYRQTVAMDVLTPDGRKTGEQYFVLSDILFDDKGRRVEKVVKAPPSTLEHIILTPEDLQDIQNIYPFVLTTDSIEKYNLTYLGKEKIDEIDCYVFDVSPKRLEGEERYFEGKIWVDDQDLQIVKTFGKTVYQVTRKTREQRFPRFETYRGNVDGKYWFPIYTKADDTLHFSNGNDIRIREVVKYENYKRFEAEVKITVADEGSTEEKKTPPK